MSCLSLELMENKQNNCFKTVGKFYSLVSSKLQMSLTCLFPPDLTIAMMMFSDAMKGSSCRICFSITCNVGNG